MRFILLISFAIGLVSSRAPMRKNNNPDSGGSSARRHHYIHGGTDKNAVLTEDLLFFFFLVPPGRPGYELPFANKQCYMAAHNYSMLLEVVVLLLVSFKMFLFFSCVRPFELCPSVPSPDPSHPRWCLPATPRTFTVEPLGLNPPPWGGRCRGPTAT